MLILRPADLEEAEALTELCLRSKAVWGYDEAFLRACRWALTITAEDLRASQVMVAEDEGTLVGMAQLSVHQDIAALDKLFIEPAVLRSGAGRVLFDWCVAAARSAGAVQLVIEADPEAAGFYRRMGAVDDGSVPSGSIPGRFLPRLTLDLAR